MLKLRVFTAIALLALLLPLLLHSHSVPFVATGLLILSVGAWEWGRLNGLSGVLSVSVGMLFGTLLAVVWWQYGLDMPFGFWLLAACLWLLLAPWLLKKGVAEWGRIPMWLRLCVGLFALTLAWVAMAQARTKGINFLLSLFALVWVADIAAYIGGKALGRRKLAPSISPGKSWEGVVAGWLGVMTLAVLWIWVESQMPSTESQGFYSLLFSRQPVLSWFVFSALAGISVLGDLVESLVKRSAGFKDSSGLLPGHGGVLDRVDALLPVLPMAMIFVNY